MVITSLDNPKIKKYLKLKTKKYRDEFKLYLVETDNLIKEAINNNCLVDLLVLDGSLNKYDFNVTAIVQKYVTIAVSIIVTKTVIIIFESPPFLFSFIFCSFILFFKVIHLSYIINIVFIFTNMIIFIKKSIFMLYFFINSLMVAYFLHLF